MAENLVIVESPAKAKTIQGYLGSDYDQTDVSSGVFVRETDVSFSGVVFSIGGRF